MELVTPPALCDLYSGSWKEKGRERCDLGAGQRDWATVLLLLTVKNRSVVCRSLSLWLLSRASSPRSESKSCAHPQSWKVTPPLFCQASVQSFPSDLWEYGDDTWPPCLIPSDLTPQTKLREHGSQREVLRKGTSADRLM